LPPPTRIAPEAAALLELADAAEDAWLRVEAERRLRCGTKMDWNVVFPIDRLK
jgi:hypothetical protein